MNGEHRFKPTAHLSLASITATPTVMAGEGRLSTSFPRAAREDVDGRPSPAMTVGVGANAGMRADGRTGTDGTPHAEPSVFYGGFA